MCGRFALKTPKATLVRDFSLLDCPDWEPRYNIPPLSELPIILGTENGWEAISMRWGLVPSWAKDDKSAAKLINARAETVAVKPSFRQAWKQRRCLIPVSGYYEWSREGKDKRPYYFSPQDSDWFVFVGLFEHWKLSDQSDHADLITFCIITTEANGDVQSVHNRMPVILNTTQQQWWLDPTTSSEMLQQLIIPAPNGSVRYHPVAPLRGDDPSCIKPYTVRQLTMWD